MKAIQVLGKVRMSVFYPISGFIVRKITKPAPIDGVERIGCLKCNWSSSYTESPRKMEWGDIVPIDILDAWETAKWEEAMSNIYLDADGYYTRTYPYLVTDEALEEIEIDLTPWPELRTGDLEWIEFGKKYAQALKQSSSLLYTGIKELKWPELRSAPWRRALDLAKCEGYDKDKTMWWIDWMIRYDA